MAGILARSNVTRQAQISAKRLVAKDLAFNVESLRGSDTGTGSSIAKTKLVDAKLEMVRSGWLFQYCAVIRRFCLLSCLDRIQRNKIDQCLQRCAGPGEGTPCRHRGPCRLSRTDFWSQETQTSTALQVKRTSPFPSPVQKEKEQSTQRQLSRLADGTILGSSWKSKKRINESIFSKSRRL